MTGWSDDGLLQSWRALARQAGGAEWQFVHLTDIGPISVEAGCHFPGAREALIVSFPGPTLPGESGLPLGQGFDVTFVRDLRLFGNRTAVALVRRAEGSLDIFSVMAGDLLRCLGAASTAEARQLAEIFVGRAREWQEFMARRRGPLSPQRQAGLLGELWFLSRLMDTRAASDAVDFWQGPLHSVQDFLIGTGAVEVKSTAGSGTFLARINSIEQLEADSAPLFLLAIAFEESSDGTDLVATVADLRARLADAGPARMFEAMLLLSGYLDEHADNYRRKLGVASLRAFLVDHDFPCLRRDAIPPPVRKVAYSLDIDALGRPSLSLDDVLDSLGLTRHEP